MISQSQTPCSNIKCLKPKRRNPIHNQIDFILIDKKYARFLKNARSYSNLPTDSDHNMVMTNIDFEFSGLNKPKTVKNQRSTQQTPEIRSCTKNTHKTLKSNTTTKMPPKTTRDGRIDQDIEIKRLSDMRKTMKRRLQTPHPLKKRNPLRRKDSTSKKKSTTECKN